MSVVKLTFQKLKAFRMTVLSLILLVLASYRTVTSGDSIQLVGVCASIVPFFSQFRNFPRAEESVSPLKDVLSSYFLNLILMGIYLGWVLLLTWVGRTLVPSYIVNPYFTDMLFIAVCADVVFISTVIPVCRDLKPMQRMIPGLVLTNAMLIFMMMASGFVKTTALTNIPLIACGFTVLILALTLGILFAACRENKK